MKRKEEHKQESLFDIGQSVDSHFQEEKKLNVKNYAIGRAYCTVENSHDSKMNGAKIFWLTNKENVGSFSRKYGITGDVIGTYSNKVVHTYRGDGEAIYKNTRLGAILTEYYSGEHEYETQTQTKKQNRIKVNIHNRAIYTPEGSGNISELEIKLSDDKKFYRFQRISELFEQKNKAQADLEVKRKELEAIQKVQDEAHIAAAKAAELQKEIAQYEKQIELSKEKINHRRLFIRKGVSLRKQHLLDRYQERAKRSHLYDGVPVIIDGGPGTGKTTTMIQRLKFLISREALVDYEVSLSPAQIDFLTGENSINKNWLFISPTKPLWQYLRENMREEDLKTDENNTMTLKVFREKMIRAYQLRNLETDNPFRLYAVKDDKENIFIIDPQKVIDLFENYCIKDICNILLEVPKLETKSYSWHNLAVKIKSYCTKAKEIKNMEGLLDLFNSLKDNEKKHVHYIENDLKEKVNKMAINVKNEIIANPDTVEILKDLFERWRKERIVLDEDAEINEISEEEEEENLSDLDFETKLYSILKPLIKRIALNQLDKKTKLSRRQYEFYSVLPSFIKNISLSNISELAWFVKNFAFLCRGVESNILSQIPRLYKSFRKELLSKDQSLYKKYLLIKIVQKENNKYLHPDEQNLLLGFINNLLLGIYRKSKGVFEALKHKYAISYKDNVKPVLGIDEATDYTWLDYYMIYSFRHYEFSSVTLCGDIMQGLNAHGIQSWDDLKSIMPNLEKNELNISYRQLPTLLDIAREMYKDDQGRYPNYHSNMEKMEDEYPPLAFVSDDEDEKVEWICRRVLDVRRAYGEMPSVAIFVGENENIDELIQRIFDLDVLNGIDVLNCSDNRDLSRKDAVYG